MRKKVLPLIRLVRGTAPAAPAALILAPYACGILLQRRTTSLLPAAVVCAFLLGTRLLLRGKGGRLLFLAGAFFFAGAAHTHHRLWFLHPRSVSRLAHAALPVTIEGRLSGVPPAHEEGRLLRVVLHAERAGRPGALSPCTGRLYLYVHDPRESLAEGDRVAVTGRILLPRPPRNPGEQDMRFLFRCRGIDGSIFVHGGRLRVIGHSPFCFRALVWRLRRLLKHRVDTYFAPEAAPLVNSLLLGIRQDLPEETRRRFRRSGTLHLLAISGLHVGILVGTLSLLLTLARVQARPKYVLLICTTLFYTWIAGARVPIVRTAVMAVLYFLSRLVLRRTRVHNTLAAAALLILLADPLQLFMPGFILSFTAILSLLHLVPLFRALLTARPTPVARLAAESRPVRAWMRRACTNAALISAAAWTGTFPVVARFFHAVAPWAPAANVLVVPLVAAVLLCGFAVTLAPIPPAAIPLGWAGSHAARILLGAVDLFASLPFSLLRVHAFPLFYFYGGLAVLALVFRRSGTVPPRKKAAAVLAFLAGLAAWFPLCTPAPDPRTRLHLVDVGHGNCSIVTRGNTTVIIDTGSARRRRTVISVLNALRVSRIDVLILSHFDEDHAGNALMLLEEFPVATVILPPPERGGGDIREAARRRGCTVLHAPAVQSLTAGETRIRIFPPPEGRRVSANDASLVCRISSPGASMLFTADIEKKGTRHLVACGGPLSAAVLVAPHHGHTSPAFHGLVGAVRPRVVLVSQTRRDLRYTASLSAFLSARGIPCVSTAEKGYLRLTFDRGRILLLSFLR